MPRTLGSLTARDRAQAAAGLRVANTELLRRYPGDSVEQQPIHTLYAGAHLFTADSAPNAGAIALAALDEYAPDSATLARAVGLPSDNDAIAATVRTRLIERLRRTPVEDYRLDFEDGYGNRPDAEEDGHARSAAEAVARAREAGTLAPFIGIRIKPLSNELQARSLRTLDIFVTTLARATRRALAPNFVITIPKVMTPAHVTSVARACTALERRLRLPRGVLRLELMIETPQSVLAPDGSCAIGALVAAGGARVRGAHFGTYDYTALCGITAAWQHMRHAACDFAKHMMQVSLAQTGVWLSDGSTNVMPAPVHRRDRGRLTAAERQDNRDAVHRAWRMHFGDVQHSLVNGFYQGWDLHPAQLVTRYAAVYTFFLSARPAATARLRNFLDKVSEATLIGDVFDDAATGQALLNFFVRGLTCGAFTIDEALETGLTNAELQGRSFLKVIAGRKH